MDRSIKSGPPPAEAGRSIVDVIGVTEHPVGRSPLEPNRRGAPRRPSICRDWIPQGEVRRRTWALRKQFPELPHARLKRRLPVDGHVHRMDGYRRWACPRMRRRYRWPTASNPQTSVGARPASIGGIGFGRPPPSRPGVGRTDGPVGGRERDDCQRHPPVATARSAVSVGGGTRIDGAIEGRGDSVEGSGLAGFARDFNTPAVDGHQ